MHAMAFRYIAPKLTAQVLKSLPKTLKNGLSAYMSKGEKIVR
jgi:hypothetical protein